MLWTLEMYRQFVVLNKEARVDFIEKVKWSKDLKEERELDKYVTGGSAYVLEGTASRRP